MSSDMPSTGILRHFAALTALPRLTTGLIWFIQLRWLSLVGQIGLLSFVALWFKIALPLFVVIPCLAVTALSNLLALYKGHVFSEITTCGILLVLDTLCISLMLYWLGGAHNPFTAFYLLHITIAAVLLTSAWTWAIVTLCSICFGLLFLSPHEVQSTIGISCCGSVDFHLQGMLVAMILTSICIAFFIGRLKTALMRKEVALKAAEARAQHNEKFVSLATLAAGVAHELTTPLSTVAVLSADLEHAVQSGDKKIDAESIGHDARLITAEVERCKQILEKLGANQMENIGENPQAILLREIPKRLKAFLPSEHAQRIRFPEQNHIPDIALFIPVETLLQSLAILVKNACEADPTHSPIDMDFEKTESSLTIHVRDQGVGMTPEILARVTEPFFTTKPTGKGTGLGLFLVRTFVEQMHGSLEIRSSVGEEHGSVCSIHLPYEGSKKD